MNYFQRVPIRYRTILITAGVLATLFLFQAYMHHYVYSDLKNMAEFNWWREAPVPYLNFLFWALLCPLVYSILMRWPLQERPLLRTILIHLGFGLLIASMHEVMTSAIYYSILQEIGDFDFTDPANRSWAYSALAPAIFSRTMEYWVLMGVLVALENVRQQRAEHEQLLKLKSELQITQLNALKKQLQPHFLFNTLNSVSSLVGKEPESARRMLGRLGHLLRVSLDTERQQTVSLAQEVDHVSDYLGIEAVRFRDRLSVTYSVPADLGELMVPSMILQPLAENAIKHGLDRINDAVHISVIATQDNGILILNVVDNGPGCDDIGQALSHGGIGLRNVRERLRTLYGDRAAMDVQQPPGGGFHVAISLPVEQAPEHP
ncbi:MAG TPA: histidine kinase [Flavobacteriales bacterium]|jgi:two-component system LytT family sensor kinase|nr:histidine kinase [Flavobacteriales bacterium]